MDPISLILIGALGLAWRSSASTAEVRSVLKEASFDEAWAEYLRGLPPVSYDGGVSRVQADELLEAGQPPPGWTWGEVYDVEHEMYVPRLRPPFDELYAVYVQELSLNSVFEDYFEAKQRAEMLRYEEGIYRVDVIYLRDVPFSIGVDLFESPYSHDVATFVQEEEPVWWWDMREDEEFSDWDEHTRESTIHDFLRDLAEVELMPGEYWTSDDDAEGDMSEREWLVFTTDETAARLQLMEWGWREAPRLRRLSVLRPARLLNLRTQAELNNIETYVGSDLDESEEVSSWLDEYAPEGIDGIMYSGPVDNGNGVFSIFGRGRPWILVTADVARSVKVDEVEPLEGEYRRGRLVQET